MRASDPGWQRARTVARAVTAAALGTALCLAVVEVAVLPSALVPLAIAVPLFGAVALPPSPRPVGWMAALWVAVTAAAALGVAWGERDVAAMLAFVPVITAASWAGRWRTAGMPIGFLVVLAYVLARLPRGTPDDLGTVLVATTAGVAGLSATVAWVLPDRPAALLRRVVRALTSQLSLLVDDGEALAAFGPGEGRQRRLRQRLVAVQECALLADATLDDPRAQAAVADPAALRSDVLVAEALADHLAWALLTIPADAPPQWRHALAAELARVRVPTGVDLDRPVAPLVPRLVGDTDDRAAEVLQRLAAAVERVTRAARPARGRGATARNEVELERAGWPEPAPIRRVVVQAVLACAVAMVAGAWIEPAHWYWAVIGAYVVVTTTGTRGAGLRKALDRVVGTALGVAAGLALASLLAGLATAELVVLLALLVAGLWLLQISYRWTMALLTVTVALLYEVTGVLTPRVLGLRLAETALGVAVAGAVVFFVLPARTRRTIDEHVGTLLGALDDALAAVEQGRPVDAVAVRQVDRAVSTLRLTTEPLVTGAPSRVAGEVRAARLLATAVRVRVGALATATARPFEPPTEAARIVRARLTRLRVHLAEARGADAPLEVGPPAVERPDTPVDAVLQAIDDRLAGYGTARGVALREDPGALEGGSTSPTD